MPLLPAEPCVYPADLFAAPDPADGAAWWVLHTRPRSEKAVARSLLAGAVPFFLPVYEHSRRAGGRVRTSHLPLFPGYVFLRGDEEGRLRALETNQIAACIRVPGQAELRQELESVYRAMTSGVPLGPGAQLVPGAPVVIARGPLAGVKGKVLRRGNKLTLVLEVHMLSQGVAVEIESWMVEGLPPENGAGV